MLRDLARRASAASSGRRSSTSSSCGGRLPAAAGHGGGAHASEHGGHGVGATSFSISPSLPLLVSCGRPVVAASSSAAAWRSKDMVAWRSLAACFHGAAARPAPAGPPPAPPEVDPAAPGDLDLVTAELAAALSLSFSLEVRRPQVRAWTAAAWAGAGARGATASWSREHAAADTSLPLSAPAAPRTCCGGAPSPHLPAAHRPRGAMVWRPDLPRRGAMAGASSSAASSSAT